MAEQRKKDEIKDHPNVRARILPHNDEAEQSVLGCVLIDARAPLTILNELKPGDFYQKRNELIFQAMCNLFNRTLPIDIVTLQQECETMGISKSVGGLSYLTSLTTFVPSADNYRYYTDIVKKNSVLRKLIEAAQNTMERAYAGDAEDRALALAEAEIYALAESKDHSALIDVQTAVSAAIGRMEAIFQDPSSAIGIPIEYKQLNAMLNGFHNSDLVLIAARPGQGKTSIGMNFITHAALHGTRRTAAGKPNPYSCAVFSLEMSAEQLAKRMLCSVSKVSMKNASNGRLKTDEWTRLKDGQRRLNSARIYIDDSSLTTPTEILSKCRRLKREKGLDLIMVDYLQLMSTGKRTDNRQQEVSEITRTMKIAAKELDVPILLLSQMSRDIEKRTDKTPQMSDLRESGAIEQDADIIMFLHRKFDPKNETLTEEERSQAQIIVAKHRNGETGAVNVRWRGEYTSFEDDADASGPVKAAIAGAAPNASAIKDFDSVSLLIPSAEKDIFDAPIDDLPPFPPDEPANTGAPDAPDPAAEGGVLPAPDDPDNYM